VLSSVVVIIVNNVSDVQYGNNKVSTTDV